MFRVNTPPIVWSHEAMPSPFIFLLPHHEATYLTHLPLLPHLVEILAHRIQHYLQRIRLHQPAITPINNHHRSTGGEGQTMTMPRGGG